MNALGLSFLVAVTTVASAGSSFAECSYFREKMRLTHCGVSTPPKDTGMPDYTAPVADVPELPAASEKPFIKVICSCDYVLHGSDPLCDFDRNDEKTAYLPVDDPREACRRDKDLCNDLCPRQIP